MIIPEIVSHLNDVGTTKSAKSVWKIKFPSRSIIGRLSLVVPPPVMLEDCRSSIVNFHQRYDMSFAGPLYATNAFISNISKVSNE